jgi:phytoene dehydrogenase-like protein
VSAIGSRVLVVGAGAAGLACALRLRQLGLAPVVFEAAGAVGGRVQSDDVDGYRLDRGFQVLPLAYPEVRRFLDLPGLRLGRFHAGAWLRLGGRFERVGDPRRDPGALVAGLFSRVGTLADKWRALRLARAAAGASWHGAPAWPETTALERLRAAGISERMREAFFRPFLSGIFLEPQLETSSRFLELALRAFALGPAALPAGGMGAVSAQLAARLPAGALRTGCAVRALDADGLVLASGERVFARAVVVATDPRAAERLVPGFRAPALRAALALWFAAPRPPLSEPVLVLNGEGRGPVNLLCVPSRVAEGYAPERQDLVSVGVQAPRPESDPALEREVRAQLVGWFGAQVEAWRLLRVDRIGGALPACTPPAPDAAGAPLRFGPLRFACGDHRGIPSLETALRSGRMAAEAVAAALRG